MFMQGIIFLYMNHNLHLAFHMNTKSITICKSNEEVYHVFVIK